MNEFNKNVVYNEIKMRENEFKSSSRDDICFDHRYTRLLGYLDCAMHTDVISIEYYCEKVKELSEFRWQD